MVSINTVVFCPALAKLALDRLVISPEAIMVVPMARRPSGQARQSRAETVEGLDRRFLVNAEHDRVLARGKLKRDEVGCFLLICPTRRLHAN